VFYKDQIIGLIGMGSELLPDCYDLFFVIEKITIFELSEKLINLSKPIDCCEGVYG